MMLPDLRSDLSKWRRHLDRTLTGDKTQANMRNRKIDQWRKRVEKASEFGVPEVFSRKKPAAGTCLAPPLESSDLLKDQDDAHTEAQALLTEWMSNKLRLELDEEEEGEEEDALCHPCSPERSSPVLFANAQPGELDYANFNGTNCLAEEEEQRAINSILQDLMKREVLDDATKKRMEQDERIGKKLSDPVVTMEARHQQVRENRAQREAEKQRLQREREAERKAREEARRKQQREETRKKREAQRQEELLQQEMVKLRRQLEERKRREQLVHQREREKVQMQTDAKGLQSASPWNPKQEQQDAERMRKEQKINTMVHMQNLKCLQRHFSGWYSVVLDQRLHMDKATALCDWKRMLRAWRAWRAVVWEEKKRQEVARTEKELQKENRQNQMAVENHQKRLLRRCLTEWHLWCRMEKKRQEILTQQQEIQRKMTALLNAVSTGEVKATEAPKNQIVEASSEAPNQPEASEKAAKHGSCTLAPNTSAVPQNKTPAVTVAKPTQPWRVTRRHAAPTNAEVLEARQILEGSSLTGPRRAALLVGKYGHRHAVQREIIAQQRKQLKEQQEQIALLTEKQNIKGLELEMERIAQLTQVSLLGGSRPESRNGEPTDEGEPEVHTELSSSQKKVAIRPTRPHPIITAMEARAYQRVERRKQIEDLRRKREEEKLAEMKAAEEHQEREKEEQKRKAAERKKKEKRLEKEKEEEKQRELKRQQELLKVAHQHYDRSLLLLRGLAPWKRLIQLRKDNIKTTQPKPLNRLIIVSNEQPVLAKMLTLQRNTRAKLAEKHHNLFLLRRCTLAWQQSAKEALSQKEASAEQLYQRFLLRRGLSAWKRLMDWRTAQEQRAKGFHRACTLRRFLSALLAHATKERLLQWDHQELAQKHNHRRVLQRCLRAWRQLPGLQRQEREKELRRERLSKKVAEVLPNFYSYLPSAEDVGEGEEHEPESDSSDTCF